MTQNVFKNKHLAILSAGTHSAFIGPPFNKTKQSKEKQNKKFGIHRSLRINYIFFVFPD